MKVQQTYKGLNWKSNAIDYTFGRDYESNDETKLYPGRRHNFQLRQRPETSIRKLINDFKNYEMLHYIPHKDML